MKKILSLGITAAMVLGSVPMAIAENDVKYSYTIPNMEINTTRNVIGVNQKHIKIVFDGIPDNAGLEDIAFVDSNGEEPTGGIKTEASDNTVTVSFGELKENMEYTLTVPQTVGIGAEKHITFNTVKKLLVDEDFNDWDIGEIAFSGTGYKAFSENSELFIKKDDANASVNVMETESGDRYIRAKNSKKSQNLMIGAQADNISRGLTDAEIVSVVGFREANEKADPMNAVGGWWGWCFGGQSHEGIRHSSFKDFSKNSEGFYEAMVTTSKYDTVENPQNTNQAISQLEIYAKDLLSNEEHRITGTRTTGKADSKIVNVGAVKMYSSSDSNISDEIDLTYYKAGYFIMPEILKTPEYNGVTYTMNIVFNTDMDESTTDRVTVTDGVNNYNCTTAYNNEERTLSITVNDKIYDSYKYSAVLDNIKSKDGFVMSDSVDFIHQNENDIIISPEIEGDYTYDAEARTLSFNTNIDIVEDSVNSIYVTDKRKNRKMSSTAVYGDRHVSVTVNEKMYDGCEYEFVLKGLESEEGFTMKDNLTIIHNNPEDKLNFIALDHAVPNPSLRESERNNVTTYADYADKIGVNQGYIKLVFDKQINPDTLDFVTFTDENGNAPKGRLLKTVENNVLKLEFGELLPNTEYTVNIKEGFEGIGGAICDEPVSIHYTTLDKLYIEEDFSKLDVGTTDYKETTSTPIKLGNNGLLIGGDSKNNISVNIKEADSGRKYTEIVGNIVSKTLKIGWIPAGWRNSSTPMPAFSEGNFLSIIEYDKLQAADGYNGNVGLLHHYCFADRFKGVGYSSLSSFEKDDDGFMKMQISSKKYDTEETGINASGNVLYNTYYNVDAYDLRSGKKASVSSELKNSADAGKLDSYSVAQSYTNGGDPGYKGNGIKLAYVKSGLFTKPDIIGEPVYNETDKTITYYITTDIDESTVNGIRLYNNKNGEEIKADALYDSEGRFITFTLDNELEYQSDFAADFSMLKSVDGFVFDEAPVFRNEYKIEDMIETEAVSNDFEHAYIDIQFKNAVMCEKDYITLQDYKGNNIEFDMNAADSKLQISFKNDFDYTNPYKLTISKKLVNKANENLLFENDYVKEFVLKDIFTVNSLKYSKNGDKLNVSANIVSNDGDKEVNAFVTLAVFDEKGHLIASSFDEYNLSAGEKKRIETVFGNAGNAFTVKAYAFSKAPELKSLYKETVKTID